MRRREFITLVGGAAAVWPVAVRGQQPALPVIGYIGAQARDKYAGRLRAFRQGLNEIGYVEGRNVSIEFRWAEDHNDRWPVLLADLVRRHVSVIVIAGSTPGTHAAKAATTTIPVVFSIGGDPVKEGLVASLNHPGGNLTGVTVLNIALGAKRLQILHELLPSAVRFDVLVNPTNPIFAETEIGNVQEASRMFGLQLHVLNATNTSEIETAFTTMAQRGDTALVVSGDGFFFGNRSQIVALAAHYSIPTIYDRRDFVDLGGLISYGTSITDAHREVGRYTGRILNGEKPADLPVIESTRFDLVINLKTAKALGITVSPPLIERADEVIE